MPEQNWSRETSRRTVLKTTAASIAGLSGVGSSLVSPGRSAEGSDPQPVTDPEPAPAPDLYIGPDLQEFNWLVLLGNERDSMADALTGYVEEATVDRGQKRAARESLKDIWADVEIKSQTKPWHVIQKQQEKRKHKRNKNRKQARKHRKHERETKRPEKEGKTTLYTLKSGRSNVKRALKDAESKVRESKGIRTTSVGEEDAAALSELSDVIGSGMIADDMMEEKKFKPMWNPDSSHYQMTRAAVKNLEYFGPQPSADQIGEWSKWPDRPSEHDEINYNLVVPDWFPIGVFPEDGAKAYAHAFNPHYSALDYITGSTVPAGEGPKFVNQYMSTAVTDESYKHLSFACHIIEDLAVPFHTGAWVRGTLASNAQSKYENAVNAYIDNEYSEELENIDDECEVPDSAIWDPDSKWVKHAKNMANNSTDYAHSFATKIAESDDDSPSELIESCGIEDETEQLIDWATKYAMGLMAEFDDQTPFN